MVSPLIFGIAIGVGLFATACSGSGAADEGVDTPEPDANPKPDADPEPDASSDVDTGTDSSIEPDAGIDGAPDGDSDVDTGTETDTGSDVDTDTGTDTGTETDTGFDVDTDTGTDTGTETDTGFDVDTDTGTDTGSDVDTGTGTEDCVRDGFNADLFACSYSDSSCSIIDIDVSGNKITFMSGFPLGKLGKISLNGSDPLSSASQQFFDSIDGQYTGPGDIYPIQTEGVEGNVHFTPFVSSNDAAGVSVFDASGNILQSDLLNPVDVAGQLPLNPVNARSGLVHGGRYYIAAAEELTGAGLMLSYEQVSNGMLNHGNASFPVFTNGNYPAAIAQLEGDKVALLNSSGASGASIDIIDTTIVNPSHAILHNIPLGASSAYITNELSITDDNIFAIVACDTSTLKIVNMVEYGIAGEIDLAAYGAIQDVTVMGSKAYVSVDSGEDLHDSGKVIIVNFSQASAPAVERAIDVGYGLGAIGVHSSGTIYVAAKSCWGEDLPLEPIAAPMQRIIALDPALVTQDDV